MENSKQKIMKIDEDRLSTLPDDLLLKIFSRTMSYKEALKCSRVSKRFRYLHAMLPDLHFKESEMVPKTENKKKGRFMRKIIMSALHDHQKDNVDTFTLQVKDTMSLWQRCLVYAASNRIQHLTLRSTKRNSMMKDFPFSCKNLVTLNLWNVHIERMYTESASGICFPNLEECCVKLNKHESFWCNDLLPKCPILRHLKLEAPFSAKDFPFTLSSPSLESLDLRLSPSSKCNKVIKIRLELPMLQRLLLDFRYFDCELEIKVEAPNLQEMENLDEGVCFTSIQHNQFVWTDKLLLKRAKWNKDQQLVFLDIGSRSYDGLLRLDSLVQYTTLKTLTLSDFRVSPSKFWEMLYDLPSLESLKLLEFNFKTEDIDASQYKDDDWQLSHNESMEDTIYTKIFEGEIRLTEISISLSKKDLLGFSVAREMLLLFWKNLSYLKRLTITVNRRKLDLVEAKCLQFFSQLLCHGDSVQSTKNDTSEVFQLIKKNPKPL